jgi:hypothetical protein
MYFLRIPDVQRVLLDIFNLLCEISVRNVIFILSIAVIRAVNTIDFFTVVKTSTLVQKLGFINITFQDSLRNV